MIPRRYLPISVSYSYVSRDPVLKLPLAGNSAVLLKILPLSLPQTETYCIFGDTGNVASRNCEYSNPVVTP